MVEHAGFTAQALGVAFARQAMVLLAHLSPAALVGALAGGSKRQIDEHALPLVRVPRVIARLGHCPWGRHAVTLGSFG
jgi:hypothetical protein